jgi:Cu-Zn family superoxide dismutase
MKIVRASAAFVYLSVAVIGCAQAESDAKRGAAPGNAAVATLSPTESRPVAGTVKFVQEPGGVRVVADLSGLAPGQHGFHIHANGDCSAPDFSSAGDHFDPAGTKHGAREHQTAHAGDMGNIEADAGGKAHLEYVDPKMTLEGANSVVGKAVIVHEKVDDLVTQPSGNSGARIACAVIEKGDASADAGAHD